MCADYQQVMSLGVRGEGSFTLVYIVLATLGTLAFPRVPHLGPARPAFRFERYVFYTKTCRY